MLKIRSVIMDFIREATAEMWNFFLDNQNIILPIIIIAAIITATVCIIICFIVGSCVSHGKRKKLMKRHDLDFRHFTNNSIYNTKLTAVQKSLSFLDLYYSWLSTDGDNKPIREKTTTLELTKKARECYNELYTKCDNRDLVAAFADIVFNETSRTLDKFNAYRNLARKELGLPNVALGSDACFIGKVTTEELTKFEEENPKSKTSTKSYKVTLSKKTKR